jgi:hypothetical protein
MSWLFPPLGINDSRTIANFEFMSSTIWYSYVQAHGVSNVRLKSGTWITEPHLIQIIFVKPHDKSNSQVSYLVVVIFFFTIRPFTLHCYASSYSPSPPHINHSAVTTNKSYLQCSGCKVISSLSSESATSVKSPHWAAWLWFSGVIYHRELSNSKTGPISGWTDWAADYYKRWSTFCCFYLTQSPLCRWFDTHFSASTFISSSGCCCSGGIEG